MEILDQLDELNLDAAAKTQVAALVQSLLDQVKKDAENLQAKDLKIQTLVLEPAHLRRLRYGVKNEALSSLQRDLFEGACNEDITEQLDVEPAKFFVHRHIRPQYACRACETITAADRRP